MIHALHGNLGSPEDWTGIDLPGLVAVDLWEWQERHPGISLEAFGRQFTDSLSAEEASPVLLGYSLGGRLALHALAASPSRWKAVVLVSAHPGLESAKERESRIASDRRWAERARRGDWSTFLEDWNAQPVLAGQEPGREQAGLVERREAIAGAFGSWSLGAQDSLDRALSGCRTPVLVIHGERDRKYAALASRLVSGLPGAEGRAIAAAGHRLLRQAPDLLAETVRTWLSEKGVLEIS